MEINQIIKYFSYKYKGNWEEITLAIKNKEPIDYVEAEKVISDDIQYISFIDKEYPLKFKDVTFSPWILYYKGDISLLNKRIISFVGSRNTSKYYLDAVDKIIKEIAKLDKDIVICSGLALGLDTASHEAAIKYGLKTIAILPVGIDECYPKSNYKLYEEICRNGLVISEYPPHTSVPKEKFSSRNRLITGISDNVAVIEVRNYSGSLASINWALNQGKDIYVVPSPLNEEDTINNQIIKDGAFLLTSGEDLIKKF